MDKAIAAVNHDGPPDYGVGDVTPVPDALRDALLDSRQRWRDLVTLAADLVFETDQSGRFVFVSRRSGARLAERNARSASRPNSCSQSRRKRGCSIRSVPRRSCGADAPG